MAGTLEEVGAGPGGDAIRRLLQATLNDDGSTIGSNIVADAYSASITPDAAAGRWHTITVTDNVALTINAPANPPAANRSQELVIEIVNSSGGVMGNVTWDAAFVFTGTSFTKPANTKTRNAKFQWNGAKWIALSLAGADY